LFAVSIVATGCSSKGGMMSGDDDDVGSGDDTVSDSEKQQDYDDVAKLVVENVQAAELAAMIDAVNIAYVKPPADFQTIGDNNILGNHGQLQYHYTWYCRDAVDQVDIVCDGLENHVHMQVDYTGELQAAGTPLGAMERSTKWTVRDVSVNKPRIDGDGSASFTAELATGDYTIDYKDVYTRVRFAQTPVLPSAGTIDLDVTVHRNRGGVPRAFATQGHIDLTTAAATLVFDGAQSYSFDMTSGVVTPVR